MTRRWRVRSANRPAGRQVPAKLTDEGSFVSCPARRQCPPNTTAASAATYPLRCKAPQWARFDNRQKRPAHQPLPSLLSAAAAQAHYLSPPGIVSRPGASAFFVSDGPISSNSGRNGGKNAGRNCVSALPQRATVGCDFPHLLAGIAFCRRCRSKGLRVRSPARRLTRPLAPATVGVFLSYRHPPKPSPRVAHPLKPSPWRSAALNGVSPLAFPLMGPRC